MDIKNDLTINDIINYKKDGITWREAASIFVGKNLVEEFSLKSEEEYIKRLEEKQYINSLS